MFAVNSVGGTNFINNVIKSNETIQLNDIRNARGNIKQIRFLLKGNLGDGYKLFKKAVEKQDAISQIQLSQAIHGIVWGKDQEKDFSHQSLPDLEEFHYYPREFGLFNAVYESAIGGSSNTRALETFNFAANQGYLPAILEVIHNKWKWNTESFGFAVELRPFINQENRRIEYYYGRALERGCQMGSPIYYEGLYWMLHSGCISIKYPKKGESFETFLDKMMNKYYMPYYDFDGFRHLGNEILAPSSDAWEDFVKEKLSCIKHVPTHYFHFYYDPNQLQNIMNQYKISGACFSELSETWDGEKQYGFPIDVLVLYENYKKIGQIAVRKDTLEILELMINPKIQPVINFICTVMSRSGTSGSVRSWLRQLGAIYI